MLPGKVNPSAGAEAETRPANELDLRVQERTQELAQVNVALQAEVAERKRAEEALRLIVEGTAAVSGEGFFRSLVRSLAGALQMKYAFVSEYADTAKTRVRTLAFWKADDWTDNVEYDLDGTPCESVLDGQVCYYPRDVQALFPRDLDLVALAAQCYLGVPLFNSSGEVIGHLAVLDDQPMDHEAQRKSVLRIFAARAGAELERKRIEDALRLVVESTAGATGGDFFRALVRDLALALQVSYAFVSEYADKTRTRVRTLAFWKGNDFTDNVAYDLGGTPCESVLGGEICYCPRNVQTLFPRDLDLVALQAQSYLGVPLFSTAGEVIGHLAVLDDRPMGDEQRRKSILKLFAARAGAELERKRFEDSLREAIEESHVLNRRLTREGWERYRSTAAPAEHLIYDPAGIWEAGASASSAAPGRLERPLTVRGETIGCLALAPAGGVSEAAAEIIGGVAEQLSAHVENLRLLEETEHARAQVNKRALELETVAHVSAAASTILETDRLLQTVVDLTKSSFGLYHAHIYRLDEAGGALVLAAGAEEVGRRMAAERRRIPLNTQQSLVARAARTRQGVIANDVRHATDFLPNALLPDTRSEMAVPMIVGDRLLGVLDVQSDQVEHFTDEDVRVQTTLAAQVAVALQNASLYAEQAATVARLRELDHLKSSFLANMSHELRTPLNSIIGFTDVLLEGMVGPLTEKMRKNLSIVRKNGQHLLDLINDVLDMAKIQAGKFTLIIEPFDLREVVHEVLEIAGPLAQEKALNLIHALPPADDLTLEADRVRLRQVMLNLVGNAIKFTPSGSITLRAEREDGHIRVSIRDTGVGIPPDKAERIFEAFQQVDNSTTRKAGGTGLGLPISRSLVELHGGRLWVESNGKPGPDGGSTFWIEMPVESKYQPSKS